LYPTDFVPMFLASRALLTNSKRVKEHWGYDTMLYYTK
jgi:hypothetical protein